jgi:hypothetical protein
VKIILTTKVIENHLLWESNTVSIVVPEILTECFEPLHTTDDPMMTLVAGDQLDDSIEIRKVRKIRKEAAQILSEGLVRLILSEMKRQDKHNGYLLKLREEE